jgi:iron(III) transport system substrate-binding protein
MMRQALPAIVLLAVLLGVPVLSRSESGPAGQASLRLIIFSPHNEHIREEFGRAFSDWHEREFGARAEVIWNTPGGTTDIRKMLHSQYRASLLRGESPGGNADLVFGGGTYEFDKMKERIVVSVGEESRTTTIIAPIPFTSDELAGWYGENRIGDRLLFDPQQHWFGVALSSFGIVYNRDVLRDLGAAEPTHWEDLCDPRFRGLLALINPAQSGSIATAFVAILQGHGWTRGWQLLHRLAANARYFSASSPKGPLDVSLGDAAAGVCIDFYGRYQAQTIADAGGGDRVGYIDPAGETVIDADPIALLTGAPSPELAVRFIRFCMTDEAQSLWQFAVEDDRDELGPTRFELRRLPVRRAFYDRYMARCIDQVNPYEFAADLPALPGDGRAFVPIVFSAFAIDSRDLLREAWKSIVSQPGYPTEKAFVTADDVTDPRLQRMLGLFDAMPPVRAPGGATLDLGDDASIAQVKKGWLERAWQQEGLWPVDASPADILRREFTFFFEENYREIIKLGRMEKSDDGR